MAVCPACDAGDPTSVFQECDCEECPCGGSLGVCASCRGKACLGDEDTGQCGLTGEQAYHVTYCCACWGDCQDDQGGVS